MRIGVFALSALSSLLAFSGLQAGVPLVSWDCAAPADLAPGDEIDLASRVFKGGGSVEALNSIRVLPPSDSARASSSKVYWVPSDGGSTALSLSAAMARSIFPPADRAAILEFGSPMKEPLKLKDFSAVVKFKLTGGFSYGGGNPPWELDGKLVRIAPSLTLGLKGRGQDGRQVRRPFLSFDKGPSFVAGSDAEIPLGQWRTILVSRKSGQAPELWIDGRQFKLELEGKSSAPNEISVLGPVDVGGDRSWGNAPIELASFSLYGEALSWAKAVDAASSASYMRLGELNDAASWKLSGDGVEALDDAGEGVTLRLSEAAVGKTARLMLQSPVLLGEADYLQFWYCLPMLPGGDFGHTIQAVFIDSKGAETLLDAGRCVSTHIAPGNSRLAGLWTLANVSIPKKKGLRQFAGLQVSYQMHGGNKWRNPSEIHLRDFALDSIDYSKAALYYVIGNMGGNFGIEAFNYNRSRALTDISGGARYPFLRLDNAVDQAFSGRPKSLDIALEAYGQDDELLWSSRLEKLPAQTLSDLYRKIEIPLDAPGTYRIKAKSYDSNTGAFFACSWAKLVVVRGASSKIPASTAAPSFLISPDKPFGRIGKDARRQVDFVVGAIPCEGKLELKYAIVPYSLNIPGRNPLRSELLGSPAEVKASSTLSVPYDVPASVGLAIAELWRDGKRLDREERMLGIENRLDAPLRKGGLSGLFSSKSTVPDLAQASPDGIWSNSQFHALMDASGDKPLKLFESSLEDAKRVGPYVGFSVQIDRFEPIPGVYDWDYLGRFFDAAAAHGCKAVLYMAQKYPPSWAPVDFFESESGRVHDVGLVWSYLAGGCNYATGLHCPSIIKDFNVQLARRFIDHPGFGAYYFESEHLVSDGSTSLPASHDPGNRKLYAEFLKTRYSSIDVLNAKYGTRYLSFEDVAIPGSSVVKFPKRIMHCDLKDYQMWAAERFTLQSQFDAVRAEDPSRPIIIYSLGMTNPASAAFYKRVASNGGMMANGGVHSNFDHDVARESYQAIPGLRERMEPHDMWHYEPVKNGLDEMVFGMLALGGRGMNFHYFLQAPFSAEKFEADKSTGHAAILERLDAIKQLAKTEKLHDQAGIMDLRKAYDCCLSYWTPGIRPLMAALYVDQHIEPAIYHPNMELSHLDGAKLIFISGEVIDAAEMAYAKSFLEKGGLLVLEESAGAISRESPDDPQIRHALLDALGIDLAAKGAQVAGLDVSHDLFRCGKGEVLFLRSRMGDAGRWTSAMPALLKWSGVEATRLAGSDDPFMQMHLLRGPDADYLAVTHRGYDQNAYNGPREWSGKIRVCGLLGKGPFEVDEIWESGKPRNCGVMSSEALAKGFDAGRFSELQMKVFRIKRK